MDTGGSAVGVSFSSCACRRGAEKVKAIRANKKYSLIIKGAVFFKFKGNNIFKIMLTNILGNSGVSRDNSRKLFLFTMTV